MRTLQCTARAFCAARRLMDWDIDDNKAVDEEAAFIAIITSNFALPHSCRALRKAVQRCRRNAKDSGHIGAHKGSRTQLPAFTNVSRGHAGAVNRQNPHNSVFSLSSAPTKLSSLVAFNRVLIPRHDRLRCSPRANGHLRGLRCFRQARVERCSDRVKSACYGQEARGPDTDCKAGVRRRTACRATSVYRGD